MVNESQKNIRPRHASEGGEDRPALRGRPPIVVVVGHVDHGKTTFLDYVRKANVASREAGGITQAVGAYEITHGGRKITFIDTPGHEAFSKMRSRGAEVADLAILVVAADEGVKTQTKEAIQILNEAKTPFIVAINKIDRTGGDMERAKQDLAGAGVFLEGYGGQVSFHGISAKTGEGINELLDLVLLASDLENLTFDPSAHASGFILEVSHDARHGSEVSVIVKNGVLTRGETVYTKTTRGKVKILENFLEKPVQELTPSAPAVIIGFEKLPQVGEEFSGAPIALDSEAKQSGEKKLAQKTEKSLSVILKASDAGSLEALSSILSAMGGEKPLAIIEASVGDVTDGDIKNAIATGANIIGFKVKIHKGAQNLAEAQKIKIVTSDIIYDLVKTVEEFLTTLGQPTTMGELEVLAVFNQKRPSEQLIGGRVLSGAINVKASFEIIRGDRVKAEGMGKILTLREKKTNITHAPAGKEIGLVVNSQVLILAGDRLVVRK